MSSARRSERLRRKRQTTPGLSQPGAYSLHGNGYIVESEISALPSSGMLTNSAAGKDSRRMRYKDSPHQFLSEESAAADEQECVESPQTPTGGVVDKVRLSLFDILGSAARRPVNSRWRTTSTDARPAARSRLQPVREEEEEIVEDVDEGVRPNVGGTTGRPEVRSGNGRRVAPIVLLVVMFVCAMGVLLLLDERVKERKGVGKPAWMALRDQCAVMTERASEVLSIRYAPDVRTTLGTLGNKIVYGGKIVLKVLFRNAWKSERIEGDFVSREELESVILPTLLTEARRAGAEEAARISRDLNPAKGWESRDDFVSISERYAADKGLPADYALASFGASIVSSWPSMLQMYVRYIRESGMSLLGQSQGGIRYKYAWPLRPITMLQPEVLPGNCWAFPGSRGSVTIQLARPVRPSSVTVEHTPKGSASSVAGALRDFRVWGIALNASGVAVEEGAVSNLGEFRFDMSDNRRHLQSFVLNGGRRVERMRAIRLEILSNHGAAQTCIYRFRVHGDEE